jgi:hypothetical protein
MGCALRNLGVMVSIVAASLATPLKAQDAQPDRLRGEITRVDGSTILLKTLQGRTVRLGLPANVTLFSLSKASFADIDFGTYVGAVSRKMPGNIYSPIYRDSLVWLHEGFELRIIDEKLRGIAVGLTKWDLTEDSVMTHGWIDDLEERVLSVKYGPTEEEETDVEISRDRPVLRMSLGDRSLLKPGAKVLVGAQKGADGSYATQFIFIGRDGVVPPM